MSFTRGRRMGVDVGNARVGLALCDPDGILATPLKTLRRDLKKDSDRRVLRKLMEVHEVTEVFVGLPRTMKGGESPSTVMARDYAEQLAAELAVEDRLTPIWLIDERLTTVSAHRALHEAGVSSRDFKTMVDQVAAVNILQSALDTIKAGQQLAGYRVDPKGSLNSQDSTVYNDETENPNV